MNSKNTETHVPRRLLLNLTNKTNLKGSDKYVALTNLSIQYTWTNTKKSCKINKVRITARTWNE